MKILFPPGPTADEVGIAFQRLGQVFGSTSTSFQRLAESVNVYTEPYNKRTEQKRQIKNLFRRVLFKEIKN